MILPFYQEYTYLYLVTTCDLLASKLSLGSIFSPDADLKICCPAKYANKIVSILHPADAFMSRKVTIHETEQ